ncbi:MAG: fasciclin domain-containing protein [Alphaproteobacteria bacterium]|nr:fasciclin domain-containing protein [Alphaproteobacteria bacterium]
MLSRSLSVAPLAILSALALSLPAAALAQTTDAAQPTPAAAPSAPATPALAASPNLAPAGDIVATLKGNPDFTILVKALDAANLSAVLAATPNLTLFAPTDEAFKALPPAQLDWLMKNDPDHAAVLQKVLVYHLVHLDLDASKIKGAKGPVTTVEGQPVQVDGSGDVAMVNDAHIIQSDVKATNGYIHVIDKVLIPSDVTIPAS